MFDCRADLVDPVFGKRAALTSRTCRGPFHRPETGVVGAEDRRNGAISPDPASLAARLAVCGVGNHSQVVAYDDAGGMFAARLWWMPLARPSSRRGTRWRPAGLDGAGLALDDEPPRARPATYTLALCPDQVDTQYVQQHLGRRDMLLLDARSPDRFRGENEVLDPVGGTSPAHATASSATAPTRAAASSRPRYRQ